MKNHLKEAEVELHKKLADKYKGIRWKNKNSTYYNTLWIKNLLDIKFKFNSVLDYGCGTGSLYPFLKQKFNGAKYTGIDISPDMLKVAKESYPDGKFIEADGENLPFKNKTFDLVIVRGALHHLPNPEKGLKEISRVLKPKGFLIASEPSANFITSLMRRLVPHRHEHFSDVHKEFYVNEFNRILIKNNLKPLNVKYWGYLAYPFAFPDIIPQFSKLPFSIFKVLVNIDKLMKETPILNKLSWGITVTAKKSS